MDNTHSLPLIETLWREQGKAPFPRGVAGTEVAGICVSMLDTFTAGSISCFLGSGGKLDRERIDILASCSQDLAVIVPLMTGDAKEYFARLERLAKMVLELRIS